MAILSSRSVLYICITVVVIAILLIFSISRSKRVLISTKDGTFELESSEAKEMAEKQLNNKTSKWNSEIESIDNLIKKGGLNKILLDSMESLRHVRQLEVNQAVSFFDELSRFKDMNATKQEDLLTRIFQFLDPDHNKNVDVDFGIVAKDLNTSFIIDTLTITVSTLRDQLANSNSLIAKMSEQIKDLNSDNKTLKADNDRLQKLYDAVVAQEQNNINKIASAVDAGNETDNSLIDSLEQVNARLYELQNKLNSYLPYQIQNLTFTAPKAATNKKGGFKTWQVKNLEVNFRVVSNQLKTGQNKIKLYYSFPDPKDKIGNSRIIDSTHIKTITLGEPVSDFYENFDFVPGLYTVEIKILKDGYYQTLGIIPLTIKVPSDEKLN